MRIYMVLLTALLLPVPSVAGGTLSTQELHRLLRQMPEVWKLVRSDLRLSDSAYAEVRLGLHFVHLSGGRTGPYLINAKSRLTGKPLFLVLCTRVRFLDGSGRVLPDSEIEHAVKYEETLTGVTLKQMHDSADAVSC